MKIKSKPQPDEEKILLFSCFVGGKQFDLTLKEDTDTFELQDDPDVGKVFYAKHYLNNGVFQETRFVKARLDWWDLCHTVRKLKADED